MLHQRQPITWAICSENSMMWLEREQLTARPHNQAIPK